MAEFISDRACNAFARSATRNAFTIRNTTCMVSDHASSVPAMTLLTADPGHRAQKLYSYAKVPVTRASQL